MGKQVEQLVLVRKGNTEKRISIFSWNRSAKDKDGKLDGWEFVKNVFVDEKNKLRDGLYTEVARPHKSSYIPPEVMSMVKTANNIELPGNKSNPHGEGVPGTLAIDPNAAKQPPITIEQPDLTANGPGTAKEETPAPTPAVPDPIQVNGGEQATSIIKKFE